MSYLNKKNKLHKLFIQSEKNTNSLNPIKFDYTLQDSEKHINKNPKDLYDSGWIEPGVLNGTIVTGNQEVFCHYYSTTKKGQSAIFYMNYNVSNIFDIPELYLPFIKPTIMIGEAPTTTVEGTLSWSAYDYGSNYWEFYGDSNLIYKGYSPENYFFSDTERENGNFNTSFASKWYYFTLSYSNPIFTTINGYMAKIITYYNVSYVTSFLGTNYYNYEKFECEAIDVLSSGTVQGTGTYTKVIVTDNGEGNPPSVNTTIIKNYNTTAPIFEDTTTISYLTSPFLSPISTINITFIGTFSPTGAIKHSFSASWTSSTEAKYWKIFYSSSRAKYFRFSTSSRNFSNLPLISDYQSGLLPHTHLYVQENLTDDYPPIYQEQYNIRYAYNRNSWAKIGENKYRFLLSGLVYLSSPAIREESINQQYVNESYSQSGGSYSLDSLNRNDKSMPIYFPIESPAKFRWKLTLINPKNNFFNQNYKV